MFRTEWLEAWIARLPTFDDPPAIAPATLLARCALYRAARERGFERVIDGDGGDELFELPVAPADLLPRDRARGLLLLVLDRRFRRRGPRLGFLAQLIRRRTLDSRFGLAPPLPAGVAPDLMATSEVQAALTAFRDRLRLPTFYDRLVAILLSTASASACSASELLGANEGVQVASPLWDADIAELAMALDPRDLLKLGRHKAFLRAALPADAGPSRSRRTDDRIYGQMLRAMAAALAGPVTERVRQVDPLARWVDLHTLRRGTRLDPDFVVRLYFGAAWMAAVQPVLVPSQT